MEKRHESAVRCVGLVFGVCCCCVVCIPSVCGDYSSRGDHSPFHDHAVIRQRVKTVTVNLSLQWGRLSRVVCDDLSRG